MAGTLALVVVVGPGLLCVPADPPQAASSATIAIIANSPEILTRPHSKKNLFMIPISLWELCGSSGKKSAEVLALANQKEVAPHGFPPGLARPHPFPRHRLRIHIRMA